MLIQFGEIKLKLLIPILFPLFLKLRKLIRENNEINSSFQSFTEFLSMICCGPLYLIIKFRSKPEKNNENNIKKENELNDIKNENKKKLEKPSSNKMQLSNTINEIINKELNEEKKKRIKQRFFLIFLASLLLVAEIINNLFRKDINTALKLNIQVL